MKCSWEGCAKEAEFPQKNNSGFAWSTLCKEHDEEMDSAISRSDAKAILRCWVKAQGGSKAAADRALGDLWDNR